MADVDLIDDDSSVESVDADVDADISLSRWDIPPEAKNMPWKDDRELQWCACPLLYEDDIEYYCYGRPFYYMIKVENWGGNSAKDVRVSDELVDMDYVPGSAEIATRFDEDRGYYVDWKPMPDNSGETANEKFPLRGDGYKVADEMSVCDSNTWTCKDSRLIRFLVKPYPPGVWWVQNIAQISDSSGVIYETNGGWPLPIYGRDCVSVGDCPQPNKWDCGGTDEQTDNENSDADTADTDDDFTETSDDSSVLNDGDVIDAKKDSACSVVLIP